MSDVATYLYCLVSASRAPSLAKAPKGLPKAGKPRALVAGNGLWLVVANAPLKDYGAAPIEAGLRDLDWVSKCALAHEAMVEHVSALGTVVPAKLFTLFTSDERALDHVKRDRRRIDRVVKRVHGHAEFGVRLTFDEKRAKIAAEREAEAAAGPANTGAGFLMRKKKVQEVTRGVSTQAREQADAVFDELAALSGDATRRAPGESPIGGARLLLDAAYLVPLAEAKAFRREAKRIGKSLAAGGYDLTVSGPWPPYNFIAGAA